MLWFALACLLHLVAGFFYLSSGLVAPPWAVLVLLAIWLALAVTLVRIRHTGAKTLTIPLAAAAVWFLVLGAGQALFDWTA